MVALPFIIGIVAFIVLYIILRIFFGEDVAAGILVGGGIGLICAVPVGLLFLLLFGASFNTFFIGMGVSVIGGAIIGGINER